MKRFVVLTLCGVILFLVLYSYTRAQDTITFPEDWKQRLTSIPGESKGWRVLVSVKLNKNSQDKYLAYLITHSTKGIVDNEGWYIVDKKGEFVTDKAMYEKLCLAATMAYISRKKEVANDLEQWSKLYGKVLTGMAAYHGGKFIVETGSEIEGLIAKIWITKTAGGTKILTKSMQKTMMEEIKKEAIKQIKDEMIKTAGGMKINKPQEFVDILQGKTQQYAIAEVTRAKIKIDNAKRLMKATSEWDYETANKFHDDWFNGVVHGATYLNFWNDLADAGWAETIKLVGLSFADGLTGKPVKDIVETGLFFKDLSSKENSKMGQAFANLEINQEKFSVPFIYWQGYFNTGIDKSGCNAAYQAALTEIASGDKITSQEVKSKKCAKTDGRFCQYANGPIIDTTTGLMWAEKDNGTNISGRDAKSYCNNYRGGGYTDWRMPTMDELAGLYDVTKTRPATCNRSQIVHVASELINISCLFFWSSEMRGSDAAGLHFSVGKTFWYPLDGIGDGRVLPVRSFK